ncbi:fibronectin type III domain-containing protein [Actinosynnema sp. NPDC023794]
MRRLVAVSVLLLVACGREQHPTPTATLTATLTSPTDVSLAWEAEPGAAGQVVEYANAPDDAYTVLEFVPPTRMTYEHRDLIPQMPFYYRVRSFHGPVSASVDVTLPPGDEVPPSDSHDWAAPLSGPSGARPVRSADAGAVDFRAEVKHANGILFTWTDRAEGEEGYLLEVRPAGAADFSVAARLDPDVRSFGLITLPTEKTATYRVRAYCYGAASDIAHQKTGGEV